VTEEQAVEDLRLGREAGLEFLMAEHEVRALRVAYAITGNRASAEDVVAEAFLKAYRNIGRFEAGRPFGPWFLRIVTNEALQVIRRSRRAERVYALLGRQSDRTPDPLEQVETNEVRRRVLGAVRELAPNERAAVTLRYLLDMDERSVAETLGWPVGTVKTRLHRARAQLRDRLGEDVNMDASGERRR
jgi:RNA polymerase sigma-70 factor (ECF subfamily)